MRNIWSRNPGQFRDNYLLFGNVLVISLGKPFRPDWQGRKLYYAYKNLQGEIEHRGKIEVHLLYQCMKLSPSQLPLVTHIQHYIVHIKELNICSFMDLFSDLSVLQRMFREQDALCAVK